MELELSLWQLFGLVAAIFLLAYLVNIVKKRHQRKEKAEKEWWNGAEPKEVIIGDDDCSWIMEEKNRVRKTIR